LEKSSTIVLFLISSLNFVRSRLRENRMTTYMIVEMAYVNTHP